MTTLVKKRFNTRLIMQLWNRQNIIMTKVGLTPATVMSMVYAEIARTGKIPKITTQVSDS